jgi:hypothetical protein
VRFLYRSLLVDGCSRSCRDVRSQDSVDELKHREEGRFCAVACEGEEERGRATDGGRDVFVLVFGI